MTDQPTMKELQAELRVLIEIHEYLQKPYNDVIAVKAHLSSRKREVRRKIAKLTPEEDR